MTYPLHFWLFACPISIPGTIILSTQPVGLNKSCMGIVGVINSHYNSVLLLPMNVACPQLFYRGLATTKLFNAIMNSLLISAFLGKCVKCVFIVCTCKCLPFLANSLCNCVVGVPQVSDVTCKHHCAFV